MSAIGEPLSDLPLDGISSMQFQPDGLLLLVASWDKLVRLYDAESKKVKKSYRHEVPVLDCKFEHRGGVATAMLSGGLDGKLLRRDMEDSAENARILGGHDAGLKAITFNSDNGMILTGGWDKQVKHFDPRQEKCVGSFSLPGKVYSMDSVENSLVVGMSDRHVHIFDVRYMDRPQQMRESPLKYQTRCVQCFPSGDAFAISSVEGKIGVQFLDQSPEIQSKNYIFKCHRLKRDGIDFLYPINTIAFHPQHGTFATGGCDGMVFIWDGRQKKKITGLGAYPTSIASLAFSHDGQYLAVASSYTFEFGEKGDTPPDEIYIRRMDEKEVFFKAPEQV